MKVERIAIENREQWLTMRLENINASEVPTVCGEGAWGSLAQIYAEKRGLRPPLVDTGVLRRGRWDEAAVFEAVADEKPLWEIRRAKIYLRSPELRLGCTPDGFAHSPDREGFGVVQAKSVSRSVFRKRWLLDPNDNIREGDALPPPYYALQTLTEELLSGCAWGGLAVIVRSEFDSEFRWFEVERNDATEARILENVATFWRDYYDRGIMPPFMPQRDEALIAALYPQSDGTAIDLSDDNRALVAAEELLAVRGGLERLRKDESALKAELQAKLQAHTYGTLADGRCISWKSQHRKGHAVAPSDYRVLKILKTTPELHGDDE